MKAMFAILFISISVNAQSQEELHKKYGSPFSETLTIRPGLFSTVNYAETGDACEMTIHPQQLTLECIRFRGAAITRFQGKMAGRVAFDTAQGARAGLSR